MTSRYTRLGFDTSDSELFEIGEVGMDFLHKLTDGDADGGPVHEYSAEAERAEQQQQTIGDHIFAVPSAEFATEIFSNLQNSKGYSDNRAVPSTEFSTEIFSNLQNSKAYSDSQVTQQQKVHHEQNIENGNPNVCPPDPTTQPAVAAICPNSSTESSGYIQDQQSQGGRGSVRWVRRDIDEPGDRWRAVVCESYLAGGNSARVRDDVNANLSAPSSRRTIGPWTPSTQRGTSYRDQEPALGLHQSQGPHSSRVGKQCKQSQPHEKQSCVPRTSCINVCHCQRCSKESSPREGQFNTPIPGPEKRSVTAVMQHPTSDASHCGSFTQERVPNFQRSSSAREAPGLQRSTSTRDAPGQRTQMPTENWRDNPASKTAPVSDKTKYRVSFSSTGKHEVETHKLSEKFREPVAPCLKVFQAKEQTQDKQPLRYNYEQPGFVEREKENICAGKAYTIYGVKESKECCPKVSSGRHHQLVRALSVRENGSNYTKMPRSYSVNSGGRHLMPMDCDTCGKGGVGIVFLGLPGEDANFCTACRSSSGSGFSCGESKFSKKKKSIMDYCRKILRLPQKSR